MNNAGVSVLSRGDILVVSPESFDRCVGVNLRAQFFLTQVFAVRLQSDKRPELPGRLRPGMMKTNMTESSRSKYDALIDAGFVPTPRWGELEETSGAVAQLAAPSATQSGRWSASTAACE